MLHAFLWIFLATLFSRSVLFAGFWWLLDQCLTSVLSRLLMKAATTTTTTTTSMVLLPQEVVSLEELIVCVLGGILGMALTSMADLPRLIDPNLMTEHPESTPRVLVPEVTISMLIYGSLRQILHHYDLIRQLLIHYLITHQASLFQRPLFTTIGTILTNYKPNEIATFGVVLEATIWATFLIGVFLFLGILFCIWTLSSPNDAYSKWQNMKYLLALMVLTASTPSTMVVLSPTQSWFSWCTSVLTLLLQGILIFLSYVGFYYYTGHVICGLARPRRGNDRIGNRVMSSAFTIFAWCIHWSVLSLCTIILSVLSALLPGLSISNTTLLVLLMGITCFWLAVLLFLNHHNSWKPIADGLIRFHDETSLTRACKAVFRPPTSFNNKNQHLQFI